MRQDMFSESYEDVISEAISSPYQLNYHIEQFTPSLLSFRYIKN